MFEHDGCKGCIHENADAVSLPCSHCRGTVIPGDLLYHKCADLYEPCLEPKEEPRFPDVLPDMVNHPSHYNQGKYECIDVMVETFGKEATMDFCLLNAFKYVWRTGEKNGAEDVKKADWYLHKYLELEGKKDD